MNNLSNERLKAIADIDSPVCMAFPPSHDQCAAMARELLARREAAEKPVAHIFQHPAGKLFWAVSDDSTAGHAGVIPVYADPPLPVVPQSLLRELVDIVWQNAKESTEVPATSHADELIARVFTSEPVSQPYKLPVVPDERAAFESFMSERFGDSIDIRRAKNGDNEYMAWDVAVAWIVWQQKVMLAAAPKPGVK